MLSQQQQNRKKQRTLRVYLGEQHKPVIVSFIHVCACGPLSCLCMWSTFMFVHVVHFHVCACGPLSCLCMWSTFMFVHVVHFHVCACGALSCLCMWSTFMSVHVVHFQVRANVIYFHVCAYVVHFHVCDFYSVKTFMFLASDASYHPYSFEVLTS